MRWISLLPLAALVWAQQQDFQPPAHFRDDNFAGHQMDHREGEEHQHNAQNDHENFLGKDRAQQFDTLTPEESIQRLKDMIVFIDKDQNKIVSEQELRFHLDQMHKNFISQDVERNWQMYPPETTQKGGISWEDYIKHVYNPIAQQAPNGALPEEYIKLQKRDKRRWEHADLVKNGILMKEEYGCFMHPQHKEACPHMRDVIALEAKDDIDTDKDGYISMDEFIGTLLLLPITWDIEVDYHGYT